MSLIWGGEISPFLFRDFPICKLDTTAYFCPHSKNEPMTLTQTQVDDVMKILNDSSLDPQTQREVQQILSQSVPGTPTANSTPYGNIKEYCAAYKASLESLGTGIAQPNYEDDTMLVYMERNSVCELLNYVPDDGYLAAILGIHVNASSQNQVTISLLATDNNKDFVKDQNRELYMDGMECWPCTNTLQNFDTVFS